MSNSSLSGEMTKKVTTFSLIEENRLISERYTTTKQH